MIEFGDKPDRSQFLTTFTRFIKEYPFGSAQIDSTGNYVSITILPVGGRDVEDKDSLSIAPVERSRFSETPITPSIPPEEQPHLGDANEQQLRDTLPPSVKGGTIRLFTERGFFDHSFGDLVWANPFAPASEFDDTSHRAEYLKVVKSSPKELYLQIKRDVTTGRGRALSALDFIDQWAKFIRQHPAEGKALFRYVEGLDAFIRGEEAIIRGFYATDERTIRIRYTRPDPQAQERVRNNRLLWGNFQLGPYFVKGQKSSTFLLLRNKHFPSRLIPFIDSCFVELGNDNNPILSYSLKKYDGVVLVKEDELHYARNKLLNDATLSLLSIDRYFLSLNIDDPQVRDYLRDMIKPNDVLRVVKIEGESIDAVESDEPNTIERVSGSVSPAPAGSKPYYILFRKDDPISRRIAEKLLADFMHSRISVKLKPADAKQYEMALVMDNYDCAVGWVPQSVLNDTSEQLRLATLWFDDERDERRRLAENTEIPLFTAKRFLLARNEVGFYKGEIEGVYLKQESNVFYEE